MVIKKPQGKKEFFEQIESVLNTLNYKIEKNDGQYIVAISTHKWDSERNMPSQCKGKRKISINHEDDYINIGIDEDACTRTVYNGIIWHVDEIAYLEERTNTNVYYVPKEIRQSQN